MTAFDNLAEKREGRWPYACEMIFTLLDDLLDDAQWCDDAFHRACLVEVITVVLLHFPAITAPKLVYLAERIATLRDESSDALADAHCRDCLDRLCNAYGSLEVISIAHSPTKKVSS